MQVKGSKEYQYRVVRHRPSLKWWALALAVAVVLVASAVAALVGYKLGMAGKELAVPQLAEERKKNSALSNQVEQLQQQLSNVQLGSQVDKTALESVRKEVAELTQKIANLEEENQFYRNLMAPAGNKRGLTFGAVEIFPSDSPRSFGYKVVMQQLATRHNVLNGTLSFNVVGRMNGALRVFALKELADDVDSTNIKLRFKYFQNIEGTLTLPQGFEPERIELEARSTGSKATTVEKRFGWLVDETH